MGERRGLPLLRDRDVELSTCGYCPRLCRATCPVSNAEPKDALTPWGKMSSAWRTSSRERGVSTEEARLAWACTGCHACREGCDHRNPVAASLNDARAAYVDEGRAPARVAALHARLPALEREKAAALALLSRKEGVSPEAKVTLLLGCRYTRVHPRVAEDAIALASAVFGSVRLAAGCCGAYQRAAGLADAADAARASLAAELSASKKLVVLDPGCAAALGGVSARTLIEVLAEHRLRFGPLAQPTRVEPHRYHDPCALGRGLGQYEQPRALLSRVLARAPEEFENRERAAHCSGAGGILPVSMPTTARQIAETRRGEHEAQGGGVIVTGCASSLSILRKTGARAVDIVTLLRQSLDRHG